MKYTKKENRGGKRTGAGRKKIEHNKIVLSFRVDERHAKDLKIKIKKIIQDYKKITL